MVKFHVMKAPRQRFLEKELYSKSKSKKLLFSTGTINLPLILINFSFYQ